MKLVLTAFLLVTVYSIFNYKDAYYEGDMYLSNKDIEIFSADSHTFWGETVLRFYHEEELDASTAYFT